MIYFCLGLLAGATLVTYGMMLIKVTDLYAKNTKTSKEVPFHIQQAERDCE